jgi:regulatory protein SWI6
MQVARSAVSSSFPAGSPPQAKMYANSPHGLMAAPAAFNRSFSDMNGFQQHQMEKPQIYTVRTRAPAVAMGC